MSEQIESVLEELDQVRDFMDNEEYAGAALRFEHAYTNLSGVGDMLLNHGDKIRIAAAGYITEDRPDEEEGLGS